MPKKTQLTKSPKSRGKKRPPSRNPRARSKRNWKSPVEKADDSKPKRLNQFIARSGICSRREADALIEEGRIKVNGKVMKDFSYRVQADDKVYFGSKELSTPRSQYILLNKPKDTITTVKDEKNRSTVMDLLPKELKGKGLFPVGRLDRNTLGALVLTNDGDLAEGLMHPRHNVKKLYLAKSKTGPLEEEDLVAFLKGVESDGETLKVDDIAYADSSKKEVGILMHHGKNRHIRRLFESRGHEVSRLERIEYAGLNLKGLRRGKWRTLTVKEIRSIKKLVKKS